VRCHFQPLASAVDHSSTTLPALQQRYGHRYRWLVLLAVMVGTMAGVMSSTVVSVALPAIGERFHLGQGDVQWVNTLFMLAMTVSMLITPWLLRRLGYRQTYVLMMWLLMSGGILGGLAQHFGVILFARLLEGVAAGVIQPIPAIIVMRAFEPHEQGRASGVFGMAVVLAPALGPSLGGLLIEWLDWRAIFWMVVPFCAVAIWLAYRLIPSTGPGGIVPDRTVMRMDWMGLLLLTLGVLCLMSCIVVLRRHSPASSIIILGAACMLLGTFMWQQLRVHRQGGAPLISLSLFANGPYALGSFVAFVYGFALYGSTYVLAVFMQTGLKLPASQVGIVLLPAGLVLALSIGLAGAMMDKISANRLIFSGQLLMAISFALMVFIDIGAPLQILVFLALAGRLGMGLVAPALNVSAMSGIGKTRIPDAASAINFSRLLGGAIGMFSLGVALDGSGEQIYALGSQAALRFNSAFLLLAGLCFAGFIAALRLPSIRERQHGTVK